MKGLWVIFYCLVAAVLAVDEKTEISCNGEVYSYPSLNEKKVYMKLIACLASSVASLTSTVEKLQADASLVESLTLSIEEAQGDIDVLNKSLEEIRQGGQDDKYKYYNYLDEVAQASCVGLWDGLGYVYAVRRDCQTSGSCSAICADPSLRQEDPQVADYPMTCFNSIHVYAFQPRLGPEYQTNTEKLGLKVYKYNSCEWETGHCGPNFCCCVVTR